LIELGGHPIGGSALLAQPDEYLLNSPMRKRLEYPCSDRNLSL
jgi:hypothetical protein